jgi:hypothetical protein
MPYAGGLKGSGVPAVPSPFVAIFEIEFGASPDRVRSAHPRFPIRVVLADDDLDAGPGIVPSSALLGSG